MKTYRVFYKVLHIRSGDDVRITDDKIMRVENLDELRKKLAKSVIKRSTSRYDYSATVCTEKGDKGIGIVTRIYADDGKTIIGGWEPLADKYRDEGIYYEIDMRTGKLGKKKREWDE